jgi:hypothetical protein
MAVAVAQYDSFGRFFRNAALGTKAEFPVGRDLAIEFLCRGENVEPMI